MGELTVWQIVEFLAAPFVASLILTGIHAYLGVHVVERGVIFVDLSLAQIAALGATIALLLPFSDGDPHAPSVYWVSLAFTFIGAGIFSLVRTRHARIPQEAIIGITYAVASAAAILAMSKSTSQAEHLKDMLVGNILAVSWPEVFKTAGLYGAVGLFHYIFRKPFLAISMSHEQAEATGLERAALGLPVLRLVRLRRHLVGRDRGRAAGVLLPDRAVGRGDAVRRRASARAWRSAGQWGRWCRRWACTCRCVLDLPTGATIVCTFGLVLILMAAVRPLIRARRRKRPETRPHLPAVVPKASHRGAARDADRILRVLCALGVTPR